MFLGSQAITERMSAGEIVIAPFNKHALKPASYVLPLGRRFRRWRRGDAIDLWHDNIIDDYFEPIVENAKLLLQPGEFMLAQTCERIGLSENIVGSISPLSHIAQFGLGINGGADWISPKFGERAPSYLALELYNYNGRPLLLRAGMPICHLRLAHVVGPNSSARLRRSLYEGRDPLSPPLYRQELGSYFEVDNALENDPKGKRSKSKTPMMQQWPPYCCVPAFVAVAVRKYGVPAMGPAEIAARVGVYVGVDDENPFQLRITERADQKGIDPRRAAITINKMLAELKTGLAFRHVQLNEIAVEAGREVLKEALQNAVTVGVGVDYSRVDRNAPPKSRHLLRVQPLGWRASLSRR